MAFLRRQIVHASFQVWVCGRVPEHPDGYTDCHCGALLATGTKAGCEAKSWPQVRYEGEGGRAEDPAHRHRDGRFTQGEYPPNLTRPSTHEPAPPFLTPQRLPCEQVR